MKARLAKEIGTGAYLRVYVSSAASSCPGDPVGRRGAKLSYHNAKVLIATSDEIGDFSFGGCPSDYMSELGRDPRWPERCEGCEQTWEVIGEKTSRKVFHQRRWDTPDGELHPGDLFFATWEHWEQPVSGRIRDGKKLDWKVPTACPHGWSNCDGRHLHAICPDGHEWDVDGRASNCNRLDDQEHRCWVRSGVLPAITVNKGGNTCSAGAGSVLTPSWHGFLRNGNFSPT